MRQNVKQLLAQKGQAPVLSTIDKTIQDFKQMRYTHGEIKETVREFFYGIDGKVDEYIISKGY
jgi:hypothetical protein